MILISQLKNVQGHFIPTVKEKIGRYVEKYKKRTATHRNQVAAEATKTLLERRLKRKHPADLTKGIK